MKRLYKVASSVSLLAFYILFTSTVYAHCDSMEGPVINAAIKSLETGNINYSLIWIPEKDEPELIRLFEKVLKVRKFNDEAKTLADNYFFETLVRIHRMGEGVSYTGIKPDDYKIEQGILDADKAIENGSMDIILTQIPADRVNKISQLFAETTSKKNFDYNNVAAGREYVESYVHFIHSVEEVYATGKSCDKHH